MNYSKVEGHSNLIRDESTKAILNTNMTEYKNYLALKKSKENETKRIENLESDIKSVKDDLTEIKDLLRGIINEPR